VAEHPAGDEEFEVLSLAEAEAMEAGAEGNGGGAVDDV
jgi:hypothetical protein